MPSTSSSASSASFASSASSASSASALTTPNNMAHLAPPERRVYSPLDPAHRMDWEPLHLGHPHASKKTLHLLDMDAHVFGLEEIAGSGRDVAVIIIAHGWANKARDMEPMASGLIGEMNRLDLEVNRKRTRDVLVATLDQRNHGDRRRIRTKSTFETNPSRLIELSMSITGGKVDHQFMMDFLPQALFPRGERNVVEFMSTGFSMGGHVSWRLLREDPRIRIAVPICTMPSESLGPLFMARKLPPGSPDTLLPPSTKEFFLASSVEGTYKDKKILSLHGALDMIMPHAWGQADWDRIAAECPAAAMHVQPDAGHIVSTEMVRMTAEWLWYYGLTEA